MNTIHVVFNCYWNNGMSGGDRRMIEILRRWQGKKEYNIYLYTTKQFNDLLIKEEVVYKKVFLTETEDNNKIIDAYFKRMNKCYSFLKQNIKEGDIIYSPTDIMPDVIPAYKIKKKYGDKISWYMIVYHIYESFYKRPGNIFTNFLSTSQQRMDIRLAKNSADGLLSTSAIVLDKFRNSGWEEKKLFITDCSVDIDAIKKVNASDEHYDAVFLARLNYSKGIMELPEIWGKVCKKHPHARLAIIGKGNPEILEELNGKIKSFEVENNIELKGYMSTEDAFALLKASDLFLFTSHEEGWGMAIAEAMTCGLPVVAYELEIYKHVFGDNIVGCKLLDTDAMAEAVCRLLEDNEYRKELGRKGQEYVLQRYSFEKTAQREWDIVTLNRKMQKNTR